MYMHIISVIVVFSTDYELWSCRVLHSRTAGGTTHDEETVDLGSDHSDNDLPEISV